MLMKILNTTKTVKFFAFALLLILSLTALAGCGKKAPKENTVVKLGVTGAIYEDLWKPAIEALAKEGIQVELVQFSDFALPNNALNSGDIQMNAFQHHAYFENDKSKNNYDISILSDTFLVAMNIFSKQYKSPSEIPKGSKIVVPNDATNYGRALLLLQDAGLLTLNNKSGSTPAASDIVSSKVELVEVNASMTWKYVDDSEIAAAVVNGNYAASYKVDPNTAIYNEHADLSNKSFVSVIAVKSADLKNEIYQKVAKTFCSDITKKYIDEHYKGFFIPAWDEK